MRRILPLAMALILSACATTPDAPRLPPMADGSERTLTANPSEILALELAMARAAKSKGFVAAMGEKASAKAQILTPARMPLPDFMAMTKGDAPILRSWDVHAISMSCDGRSAATSGVWRNNDGVGKGRFITIWQRIGKDGWKWVMSYGRRDDEENLVAPEFIATNIASCQGRAPAMLSAPAEGVDMKIGLSHDQSLSWTSIVSDTGTQLEVKLWDGGAMRVVETLGRGG